MNVHSIQTARTARYFTLGDPARCCEVWFLLHGYGQGAAEFLRSCEALACDGRLLVAPEALSRFYLRGGQGPIGASWMTREDRESEIFDYVRYLDLVAARVPLRCADCRHAVFGFSQGAPTAVRWAALGNARLDRLVLAGGGLPQDVDLEKTRPRFESLRISLTRGTQDRVYDESALASDMRTLAQHGIAHDSHRFDGDHRVDGQLLRRIADH